MSMTITTFDETAFDIPSGVDTLNGFRRWAYSRRFPERGRISFLDGKLEIDMSPEEIDSHSTPKGAIFAAMLNFNEMHDLGRVFPDGTMVVNVRANIANEPDVTFCSWQTLQSGRVEIKSSLSGKRRYMELRGSPDVVVEIVSRSSGHKDKNILRQKYYDAGIREYWLIDAQGESIDFELLTRSSGRFRAVRAGKDGSRLSAVFKRRIRITRELDRIRLWKYSIEYLPLHS